MSYAYLPDHSLGR